MNSLNVSANMQEIYNNVNEASIVGTPDGFAATVLGMDLYPRQREVLRALSLPGAAVSFRSCNEGGKTKCVICALILWHLVAHPKGHVISTSGSFRQIKDQLVPALHAFQSRFPAFTFLRTPRIETPNAQCFWEGFSTDESGKFEGHHAGGPDEPLLIIVDEAKTVRDDIFEAIERCKPTRLLIASSPGYAEGEFYRSQTTRAKYYQTFIQRATECPHWKQEDMDRLRDKWGENHPLYRSMVLAEFMESVADAVVGLKVLEDLMANPPIPRKASGLLGAENEIKAFCDFAWSGDGDENVLALHDGNVVTLEETFRSDNLDAVCGRFIAAYNRLRLKPHQIDGDEGGGGKLICDRLQAMGWRINRVNNGAAPRHCQHYANRAAEMWFEGAQQIARREIVLPDDDELRAQMLDRKRVPDARGKLAVESKRDMKRRGAVSPDRADAVFGAMTPVRRIQSFNLIDHSTAGNFGESLRDWGQNDSGMEGHLPGTWFG
jgi:phage terminase large subunit